MPWLVRRNAGPWPHHTPPPCQDSNPLRERPEGVQSQQCQASEARCFIIGRKGSPASLGKLCVEQDLRVRARLPAQGEQRQAGGLKSHLMRAPKERPTTAGEPAIAEGSVDTIRKCVHGSSLRANSGACQNCAYGEKIRQPSDGM